MNKLLYFAGLAIVVGVVGLVSLLPKDVEEVLGGGNLPDRCEYYDQFASRSMKDNVKGSAGKLYSYRIVSTATNARFFQLHNGASTPVGSTTTVYAMPLGSTTASATPVVTEERFVVPMDFTLGIGFTISNTFGVWASQTAQEVRNSYFVTLCYN